MAGKGRIITIGLSPAWDIRCRGAGLDWGRHVEIDEQVVRPAGKALNVSDALAWMGRQAGVPVSVVEEAARANEAQKAKKEAEASFFDGVGAG